MNGLRRTLWDLTSTTRIFMMLGGLVILLASTTGCGDVVGPKYPDPVIEEPGQDTEEDDG